MLVAVGPALLIYPLVQGRELDWPAWSFAMMAASASVFALFVARPAQRDPVIEPSLFRSRGFIAGVVSSHVPSR